MENFLDAELLIRQYGNDEFLSKYCNYKFTLCKQGWPYVPREFAEAVPRLLDDGLALTVLPKCSTPKNKDICVSFSTGDKTFAAFKVQKDQTFEKVQQRLQLMCLPIGIALFSVRIFSCLE